MTATAVRRLVDLPALPLALVVLVLQVGLTTVAARCALDPEFVRPGGGWDRGPGPPGPGPHGPGFDRGCGFNALRVPLDGLGYALLAAGPVALALRRRLPVAVLLVTVVLTTAYLVLGYPYGPMFLAVLIALVSAVLRGARLLAWSVGVGGLTASHALQTAVGRAPPPGLADMVAALAWLLVALLVAEAVRFRRERVAAAERAREQRLRRLADEERLRIAREVHDVLAHNISMINVQAGVALHLADDLPEQARTALQAIKDASRETLRELRATLGALRRVDEDAPRDPTPGLHRLDELVRTTAGPTLAVRTEVTGAVRRLPAGTDLAAYRIVQEALTNVHRHAGARTAWIRMNYADDTLTVTVDDDGTGAGTGADSGIGGVTDDEGSEGAGTGIIGMHERAHALGGTLSTGRRPGGGFRVRAVLPLPEDGQADE